MTSEKSVLEASNRRRGKIALCSYLSTKSGTNEKNYEQSNKKKQNKHQNLLPDASPCSAFSVSNSDSKSDNEIFSLSNCTAKSAFSCLLADSWRRRASTFSRSRLFSCLPRCRSLSTASWYFFVLARSSSRAWVWFDRRTFSASRLVLKNDKTH